MNEPTDAGLRLFTAIDIPAEAKAGLESLLQRLQKGMQFTGARPTWVQPENLHITLQFLGNQPEDRVPQIVESMAAAAAGMQAFRLELAGLELFPTARDPRVISLAIRGAVPTLTLVYEQMTRELRARDFDVSDKPFRAHVTLARIKSMKGLSGLRDVVKRHAQYKAASFTAEGIALYSSMLSSTGPSYTLLKFQPFEAGD